MPCNLVLARSIPLTQRLAFQKKKKNNHNMATKVDQSHRLNAIKCCRPFDSRKCLLLQIFCLLTYAL